ncbi:hypothetical protein [Psychrobacter urativorans]|uniref:hypothetical protein n=1 Tax=Psychrobacter urativorans TaxID=45610 RepID=UPI0019185B3A|nr:hypothetical protein [Psychrobacter urativorans]
MLNTSLNNALLKTSDLLSEDSTNDNNLSLSDLAIHSEAATAFASLPSVIQNALIQKKRIVCIANNPSIDTSSLDALLQPTDMLVLFNDFIHADYFANHPLVSTLPKLLFFRQIGDSNLHFGLPPRSNNVMAINKMANHAPLGMLLSNQPYQFPHPSEDQSPHDDPVTASRILIIPSALNDLLHNDDHCGVLSEQHPVVTDYPYFSDIHSSAPSSGFLLYRLLLAARVHVQRLQESTMPLQIVMIGFNDEDKTAHFWQGHNWRFERQEMAKAPYGVQVIRQY